MHFHGIAKKGSRAPLVECLPGELKKAIEAVLLRICFEELARYFRFYMRGIFLRSALYPFPFLIVPSRVPDHNGAYIQTDH